MDIFAHIWLAGFLTLIGLFPTSKWMDGTLKSRRKIPLYYSRRNALIVKSVALAIAAISWADLFMILTGRPRILH